MIGPFAFIVVALAAFRATRFVTADTLTVGFQQRLYLFAWNPDETELVDGNQVATMRGRAWRTYVHGLLSCPWCLGVWFSAAAYCWWRWFTWMPARAALVIVAVAGVQGFVSSAVSKLED